MYYAANKNIELAIKDFNFTEKILVANNMPGECFALLYNNISVNFCNLQNYEKSEEYLDKIAEINPSVLPQDLFGGVDLK